jgi:hypothetical protein
MAAAYLRFDAGQPAVGRGVLVAVAGVMVASIVLFVRQSMPAIERTIDDPVTRAEVFQYVVDTKRAQWDRLRRGGRHRYVLRVAPQYLKLLVIPLMMLVVLVAPSGLMISWMPSAPQALAWLVAVLGVATFISVVMAYRAWDRSLRGWAARDAEAQPPAA